MPSPHDVALFTMTAGAAVGALLMADAADEARRSSGTGARARTAPRRRPPVWTRPTALHCASLAFMGAMTISGALLMGAFP